MQKLNMLLKYDGCLQMHPIYIVMYFALKFKNNKKWFYNYLKLIFMHFGGRRPASAAGIFRLAENSLKNRLRSNRFCER